MIGLGGLYQIGKLGVGMFGAGCASLYLDHSSTPFYALFGMGVLVVADAFRVFYKSMVWKKYSFSINEFKNEDVDKIYETYFTKDSASVSSQHSEGETGK
jgi:hypothetical protein